MSDPTQPLPQPSPSPSPSPALKEDLSLFLGDSLLWPMRLCLHPGPIPNMSGGAGNTTRFLRFAFRSIDGS